MARWSLSDPNQGSAFHELITLPTLAPHLARPYHAPTVQEPPAPPTHAPAPDGTLSPSGGAPSASTTGDSENEGVISPESIVSTHAFFVLVTVEWTERVKGSRNNSRQKKENASKNTADKLQVLTMSRTQFITASLAAHGFHKAYIPGPQSGPGLQVSWTGSPGGKARAPITQDEADWKMVQNQLRAQVMRTKGRLESICVSFDLDQMDGYKNHKRALSPPGNDGDDTELPYGTHVPSLGSFSPENLKVSEAAKEIKAAWGCDKHNGACFITKDVEHVYMTRFRLTEWASAVVAGKCLAKDPPPDELLHRWNVVNQHPAESGSGKVPRGRSGPGHLPTASVDASTNILLSTMVPVMTMLAQNMTSSSSRKRSSRHRSPSSSPVRQSSPPPPVEGELDSFLKAFGEAKAISSARISIVSERLQEVHYYPDIISEVTFDRLKELTDLAEGEVLALRKFAREWSGRMDVKRAKLRKH